ncbi:MAG: T9SS C-terminal target domain-containing protein, partial [Flavobacteriales bacterium]|nr:T9SS C-terminal target domain-containing protein [Flavobacteriales bacterium]
IDRRFVQSAGPFTLEPGAYNNITLGVAYARASTGGAIASVSNLRAADDKAQALFDNCFKILDGPDAPDLEIVELDRELIIFMTNPEGSNNNPQQPVNLPPLSYKELDPIIPEFRTTESIVIGAGDTLDRVPPYDSVLVRYDTTRTTVFYDRFYRFQGYKLYQLKNADVSVADLDNVELARLVYQGDLEDNISQIINYPYSDVIGGPVATEMVNGANRGIASSVRVTEDKFAQGDPRLVNFKSYYYIAIAYGYNNYEPYDIVARSGQAFPYVASRKAAFGSIRRYVGIPHRPDPTTGGTILQAKYGDGFEITRLEGQGNGGNATSLKRASLDSCAMANGWREQEITYERGRGPVTVKVIDPLKVPLADFEIWFNDTVTPGNLNDASWSIVKLGNDGTTERVPSDRMIDLAYEQVIPQWGISVSIQQATYTGNFTTPAGNGSIEFADPSKAWLMGVPDGEADVVTNWIRSGVYNSPESALWADRENVDPNELWEDVLGGTWAPWILTGHAPFQPGVPSESNANLPHPSMANAPLTRTPSIQLVITADRSKWSRSPVFEQEANSALSQGQVRRMALRASPSIDKDGRKSGTPGCNEDEARLVNATSMGWFPGYAIDLETGERLNIGYGENSFWAGERGRDMMWNPNDQMYSATGSPFFGGCHWIYVFKNERRVRNLANRVPQYDQGAFIRDAMNGDSDARRLDTFQAIAWVGTPVAIPGTQFLGTDVRITLNVKKAYERYINYNGGPGDISIDRNNGLPLYAFSTNGLATVNNDLTTAESALDLISVVPNPYYAFSGYETSRLDNRVKFINLPQTCTISIYTVSGTLVRKFRKDNELTYLDWDLKNTGNIPIAGGMYLCHVDVPGVGEKVVKWFGAMRPLDLQNF